MGKNNWNLQDMQDTLVKDTEQRIEHGFEEIKNGQPASVATVSDGSPSEKQVEPTKGVQTYIPMSLYRRLNDIKLTRGDTIANLVAEAVALWVDVQEGKPLNIEH